MPLFGKFRMDQTTTSKRISKPRRSKGCTTCIQRKVKCDEKVPFCGQCLKGGRKCSGIASAIFLNMDSTTLATTSTFALRDLSESPQSNSPQENQSADEEPTSTKMIETVWAKRRNTSTSPKPVQPHMQLSEQNHAPEHHNFSGLPPPTVNTQVLRHQVLSHFINYFAGATPKEVIFNSWMRQLPEMLASPKRASTTMSIAAASMIFYGQRTNNMSIMMDAYKFYGAGLSIQRKTLEEIFKTNRPPTIEEIYAPLLMSFFEIFCCTSQTAYFQHLLGAARLLEAHGPTKCGNGIHFELFQTLRLQLVTLLPFLSQDALKDKTLEHASILECCPTIFCSEEWLTVPFIGREKTTMDRLVDIITICTALLARAHASKLHSDSSSNLEKLRIKTHAQILKLQLDNIWPELRDGAERQGWDYELLDSLVDFDTPKFGDQLDNRSWISTEENIAESPRIKDEPTTRTASHDSIYISGLQSQQLSFYSTARLLLLVVLGKVDAQPSSYEAQIEAHCTRILSLAESMPEMEIGYAYLRMLLPLQLVGTFSPSWEQRRRARHVLDRWRSAGCIAGICEVAILGSGGIEDVEMGGDGEPDEEVVEGGSMRGLCSEELMMHMHRDEDEFEYTFTPKFKVS